MALKMMRAIRVYQFGGLDVLKYETNCPVPNNLNENEVLIKVGAVGVNPVDTYIRAGTYAIKPELPYTPGHDCSGTVEAVGSKVVKFKKNDRVFSAFRTLSGSYAEYAVCNEINLLPLSTKLSLSQGAALGVPYFTAYRALKNVGKCLPKETVLIHGASGGVGIAAIQLAKKFDLVIIGTAGTAEGMELVKSNGAHHVLNHNIANYTAEILELTKGQGVNIILEMLANVNLGKDCELLSTKGRVVVVGCRGEAVINPRLLMQKEASISGVMLGYTTENELEEMGKDITAGIDEGWIKPVVGKEFPLTEASSAQDYVINSKATKGKVVLTL